MPDAISTARESLSIWVGLTMGLYVCLLLGISFMASRRIQSAEDFVVAGRRLGLPLATATLVATWFGAGTLMAAADEIRASGLEAAALDPLGAGLCLLIFGCFSRSGSGRRGFLRFLKSSEDALVVGLESLVPSS